jgi:hypothetical protein
MYRALMSSSPKNFAWTLAVTQPSASRSPARAATALTSAAASRASCFVSVRLHAAVTATDITSALVKS